MFICPMALLIFGEPSIISQSSERVHVKVSRAALKLSIVLLQLPFALL